MSSSIFANCLSSLLEAVRRMLDVMGAHPFHRLLHPTTTDVSRDRLRHRMNAKGIWDSSVYGTSLLRSACWRSCFEIVQCMQEARGEAEYAAAGSQTPGSAHADDACDSLLEEDEDFPSMY